jgi:FAD/FMN-containing dehydrogenase/Fe-S oxidoreductase
MFFMDEKKIQKEFRALRDHFEGDLYNDPVHRILYATDASVYREKPLAVALPKTEQDIQKIITFASRHSLGIIPRAAGTSLAGQVVGNGIVVDISKYFTHILELNEKEKWVRVQAGVNLDELNQYLRPFGLFFGPETSTSSRCKIAGMLGNNSCGSHSIIYGSTRDHTLAVKAILSDGSIVEFTSLSTEEFESKCTGQTLENRIYRHIKEILSDTANQKEIRDHYPKKSIQRRNTGYALDLLLDMEVFSGTDTKFNFCSLLAGSEGTLAFASEITLNLVDLPAPETGIIAIHLNSVEDAFKANLIALKYKPGAVELMDDKILECTKENKLIREKRDFIQGDPKSLLIVEFARESKAEIVDIAGKMQQEMREAGFGYYFPVLFNADIRKVWDLRKAGLGLLSNIAGEERSVTVIEDTAVDVEDLPAYMAEFQEILKKYKLDCVFYAHIGSGELHLRPLLNLKEKKHIELFRTILQEIADLVKKYRGSLSGEHGDGRLRGEMIPFMLGEKNYELLKQVKKTWDPQGIFNPGKITDTPPMHTFLRYEKSFSGKDIQTYFDYSGTGGLLRAVEKCNGSGDCLKSEKIGGSMCPSYMATRDEKHVTRGRANVLRDFLIHSHKKNPFDHKDIYEVMDLCLLCKACKSECPSNVDIAKLKMEFLQHYYDSHGAPFRSKIIAHINSANKIASLIPGLYNTIMHSPFLSSLIKKMIGFAPQRSLPLLQKQSLKKWAQHYHNKKRAHPNGLVYLFNDEFTNFNDSDIGIKAILLLEKLGYKVVIPGHTESARASLSKGFLRKAKKYARKNIELLKNKISEQSPLIGIEPSAILSFRDEYPELVGADMKEDAVKIAAHVFMFDEFFMREVAGGKIKKDSFCTDARKIRLHGHCQQKALVGTKDTLDMLGFPVHYQCEEIKSGCCGMAGAFGYEKEHYDLSMQIGELVLFPEIRKTESHVIIAAPGTSCRHQIIDGTQRKALHPVEIMFDALV